VGQVLLSPTVQSVHFEVSVEPWTKIAHVCPGWQATPHPPQLLLSDLQE
jgi:hypothetical protein